MTNHDLPFVSENFNLDTPDSAPPHTKDKNTIVYGSIETLMEHDQPFQLTTTTVKQLCWEKENQMPASKMLFYNPFVSLM
jgi:hypothetical protein